LSDAKLSKNNFSIKCKPKFLSFDPTHRAEQQCHSI